MAVLTDIAVLALVLGLCILAALLLSWAAPHWVEHLPATTTTIAAAAVWPSKRRNALGWYGDTPSPPGQT